MYATALARKFRDPTFVVAVLATGLCVLLLVVVFRGRGRPAPAGKRQTASSFFTDAAGTRAIFLVLRRLLPSAEQWRRPLTQLPSPELPAAPTTLLIFAPHEPLAAAQAGALDRWMAQGGQVVFVSQRDWPIRHTRGASPGASSAPPGASRPDRRGYIRSHGMDLLQQSQTAGAPGASPPLSLEPYTVQWEASSEAHAALVRDGDNVLVGSKRIGQGRLVVVPDAEAFSNRRLRHTENAVWLVRLGATWGNGRVSIDEFHHGFGARRGVMALGLQFLRTPWGWVCLHGAAAGLLYLFGTLQRFGRPYDPPIPRRSSPVDLIDARSGLLAAAEARSLAVEVMHRHLQYRLGKPGGSAVNLADPALRERLRSKSPALAAALDRYSLLVRRVQRGETLSTREFVDIGKLASHISKEYTAL